MPNSEELPKGPGPAVDQGRRKLLQTGLGLAGTALALDVMAAAKPATAAMEAVSKLRNRAEQSAADAQIGGTDGTQKASQGQPRHPTEPQGQTAARLDGTLAQQGNIAPQLGDVSPEVGLHWLEQNWQEVLEVGIPVTMVATIVTIVRNRSAANRAMESSFHYALNLLENADAEAKAAAGVEFLYLLSNPKSEKYHQRIFATAVAHFRQRNVASANVASVAERDTSADFKFVPVLVFAASAIRDRLLRKGAPAGDVREEYLNASHIHLDSLSLRDADLSYLILKHATFSGAVLGSANLSHADLTGANLSHTTLNSTNLSHTMLIGTNFIGARARNANLRHAILTNTNLENADLSYANLEGAELREGVNLQGANVYRATGLTGDMRNRFLAMGAIERDWG